MRDILQNKPSTYDLFTAGFLARNICFYNHQHLFSAGGAEGFELHRKATTASSIDSRTCWPSPLRSRASNAAVIACEAVIAVNLSGRIVLIFALGRRRCPV
jgi:hypothetical protein